MKIDELKKLLQKELEKYKKDKTSFKSYMDSMRETNNWLKGMKK